MLRHTVNNRHVVGVLQRNLNNHLGSASGGSSRLLLFQQQLRIKSTIASPPTPSATAMAAATKAAAKDATTKTTTIVKDVTKGTNILPLSIVTSPKVQRALPWIGHGAYMALVSGFLMTDMLTLRVALIGGYTGLVTFHSLHKSPLQIPLRWSALFIVVNAGAAVVLALDKWGTQMSDEEEYLYQQHFSNLSRGQFAQLLQLAEREDIEDEFILTEEGKVCDSLYFLQQGRAKVYNNSKYAANIDQGCFVNDIAFHRQLTAAANKKKNGNNNDDTDFDLHDEEAFGAYGTVATWGECTVLKWNQEELRQHLQGKPDMERNFKHTLSEQLMESLLRQREARHAKEERINKVLLKRAITKHQLQSFESLEIKNKGQ